MNDDELEKSLDQLGVKTENENAAPNDVEPSQPRISPYDVTSGLALLPKVSALLSVCRSRRMCSVCIANDVASWLVGYSWSPRRIVPEQLNGFRGWSMPVDLCQSYERRQSGPFYFSSSNISSSSSSNNNNSSSSSSSIKPDLYDVCYIVLALCVRFNATTGLARYISVIYIGYIFENSGYFRYFQNWIFPIFFQTLLYYLM